MLNERWSGSLRLEHWTACGIARGITPERYYAARRAVKESTPELVSIDSRRGADPGAEIPVETAFAAVAGSDHRIFDLFPVGQPGHRVPQPHRHDVAVDRFAGFPPKGG